MGTMILANIAGSMQDPFVPLYLQELGANVGQVGLFFTLGAIAPLLFQIFGGWLSDSLGRLQAIAIGSLGGVLGYVVYIIAPSWEWLLISTMGVAMARAFVGPSFQAFIAEQSTEETRGRVYGLVETMFRVVGVIGPPLGGLLAQGLSFKAMFIVGGILYTAAAVIRILMARAANRQQTTPRERPSFSGLKSSLTAMFGLLFAGGVITWVFISDGVRDTGFSLVGQLFPIYMQDIRGLTLIQIGVLNAIASAVTMVLMPFSGWLSDKKGERVGIVGGFLVLAVGWAGFMTARSFAAFVAAWLVFGVGDALIGPAYSSLISKVVPEKLRGTAFGLFSTSLGLISLPAPWIGARLWETYSPLTPFYVPLVGMLIMLPVMWIKFRVPANGSTGGSKAEAVPAK
jgi:MFS family permease